MDATLLCIEILQRIASGVQIVRVKLVEGYYDILEPRAKGPLNHPDPSVRSYAELTLRGIEVFSIPEDSYGYIFYVLQRC
jgi:hypothetical protein